MSQASHNQEEFTQDPAADAQSQAAHNEHEEMSAAEPQAQDPDDMAEVDKLRAEVAELNDKLLRSYSEFDNLKKRTARERLELINNASKGILLDLLPVIDDFERAMSSMENTTDIQALQEGVKLVHTKFVNILQKKGLQAVESVGQEFDIDLHEAISKMPAPSESEKNKVIAEVEKGYKLNDTVIRYAKVIVGV